MFLSDQGLHLIMSFEGFPNGGRPYDDPVGYATVGYGHLIGRRRVDEADRRSTWVHGQRHAGVLTPAEGARLLADDLVGYETPVGQMLTRPPTQGEFDALVSFAYNLGVGALRGSTLLRLFNEGHTAKAADEFPRWSRAGGVVLAGLARRRAAERELFLCVASDQFAGYTAGEMRAIREYDEIRRKGGSASRRAQLVEQMIVERKVIWRQAQRDGWATEHRAARYKSLLARTA